MKKAIHLSAQINTKAAMICAESFYKVAQRCLEQIYNEKQEGIFETAPRSIGNIVSGATNIGLSIEIYIKALRAHSEMPVPSTHHLGELYKDLPKPVKERLVIEYDWRCKELPSSPSFVSIAKGPKHSPKWNDQGKESMALHDVLERAGQLALSWRYIYEYDEAMEEKYQFHNFEYQLLIFACEALAVVVNHDL